MLKAVEAGRDEATDEDMLVAAKMVEKAITDFLSVCKVTVHFFNRSFSCSL